MALTKANGLMEAILIRAPQNEKLDPLVRQVIEDKYNPADISKEKKELVAWLRSADLESDFSDVTKSINRDNKLNELQKLVLDKTIAKTAKNYLSTKPPSGTGSPIDVTGIETKLEDLNTSQSTATGAVERIADALEAMKATVETIPGIIEALRENYRKTFEALGKVTDSVEKIAALMEKSGGMPSHTTKSR